MAPGVFASPTPAHNPSSAYGIQSKNFPDPPQFRDPENRFEISKPDRLEKFSGKNLDRDLHHGHALVAQPDPRRAPALAGDLGGARVDHLPRPVMTDIQLLDWLRDVNGQPDVHLFRYMADGSVFVRYLDLTWGFLYLEFR